MIIVKKSSVLIAVSAVALIAAVGAGLYFESVRVESLPSTDDGDAARTAQPDKNVGIARAETSRNSGIRNIRKSIGQLRAADENSSSMRVKPDLELDADEEAALNAEQRQMLVAIREALDAEDATATVRLARKLQSSKQWPDGIPSALRRSSIEALGWFGVNCLPEIAGFLVDADADIFQVAVEQYETAMSDSALSDRERAEILIAACKIINDVSSVESLMMELNNMRHSVGVDTLIKLMQDGSPAAKSVLPENIEFFTGEEGIDSAEKLKSWLVENPDDETDDETYGGSVD